ncbi:MAG TPA: bifunctional DNA primase/polymerase [Stellaceae bacterium]|jgi:hypothetical protein|nr:bifunctional DNA primase/polymerase [Stellaceae bacterium]
MSALWQAAVALSLPVFPCGRDKKPCSAHGFKDAVSDPAEIRRLFRRYPEAASIGVPTGPASGFDVIDFDPRGLAWMRGKLRLRRFPATRVHQTPRGGFHFLYRPPDEGLANSTSKLAPGVDIRATGGYVIHPPSAGYDIVDESPIAAFPRWVLTALAKKTEREHQHNRRDLAADAGGLESFVLAGREGERNARLYWAACRLGEAKASTSDQTRLISAALAVGLDRREATATVTSGINRGREDARNR